MNRSDIEFNLVESLVRYGYTGNVSKISQQVFDGGDIFEFHNSCKNNFDGDLENILEHIDSYGKYAYIEFNQSIIDGLLGSLKESPNIIEITNPGFLTDFKNIIWDEIIKNIDNASYIISNPIHLSLLKSKPPENVEFDDGLLNIDGKSYIIITHLGQELDCTYFGKSDDLGFITLEKDVEYLDDTINFKIKYKINSEKFVKNTKGLKFNLIDIR
jgi:hypothetical protein